MAKALDDTERQAIADLIRTGKSRNEIAQLVGRSPDTVSRIALDIGWTFGQTNNAQAREARSAYCAEARAKTAAMAQDRVDEILATFFDERLVLVGTAKGVEREMSPPDARSIRDLASGAQTLQRLVLDIDRHDSVTDEGKAKGLLERLVEGLGQAS